MADTSSERGRARTVSPVRREGTRALLERELAAGVARQGSLPTWTLPAIVALWAALAAALLTLSLSAFAYATFPSDVPLTDWVQQARGMPMATFLNFGGDLDGPVGAFAAYILILAVFLLLRLFREVIGLLVSGLSAEMSSQVLNFLVARPRPPNYHGLAPLGGHSFPSGHVANAVGFYGFLFYLCLVAQAAYPRWRGWLIAAQVVCVYFMLVVGPSRVLEGQHWPSDVLGGYVVGALALTAGIAFYRRLARRDAAALAREVV